MTTGVPRGGAAGRPAPQMDRYHTPRCRITWTDVHQGRVRTNVAGRNWPLTLTFGLEFYPSLRGDASFFNAHFPLESLGGLIYDEGWRVPINQLPGGTSGSLWVSMSWPGAGWALDWNIGPIVWRPYVMFEVGGYNDEFAVAEEDHYIYGVI